MSEKVVSRRKEKRSALTGLTPSEDKFAYLLALGMNARAAFIEVWGVRKSSPKSITEAASRLYAKFNIKARMEYYMEENRKKYAIDRNELIDWLREIAITGKTVQQRSTKYDSYEEMIDAAASNSAIDKLLKIGGHYAPEKIETESTTKGKFVLNLHPPKEK